MRTPEELTVQVKVDELTARIKVNRDAHRAIFEAALEKYRLRAIEEFEAKIKRIKAKKNFDTYFHLPVPEDHTEDYDRVLDMLSLHTEPTIKISTDDFARYVRDDWEWKAAWASNTLSYTN